MRQGEESMSDNQCQGPTKCGWVESERLLAKTFDTWRAEFRTILEDHRRDIQNRLEMIESRMEQKSDRENVDLIVRGINEDIKRHAEEIKTLHAGLEGKVGVETMWKIVGLVVAIGGIVSGIISAVINYFGKH